ncbi:MAG: anaerobic ribonucleoside-triphosphate reductase [Candidatus Staskawiczbacteria bacterium]|nr:anaerobic ribonucleoside-triphosphate reductase [Candidatus Staskawiczbacteria bacterium]
MESVKTAENNVCHDCGKELLLEGEELKNGVSLVYDNAGEKINVLKCSECYEADKTLSNFQECEVYSRVVGYIRPVQQWHKGKKQEFGERKEFASMPDEGGYCC